MRNESAGCAVAEAIEERGEAAMASRGGRVEARPTVADAMKERIKL